MDNSSLIVLAAICVFAFWVGISGVFGRNGKE